MIGTEYNKSGPKWQAIADSIDGLWIVLEGFDFLSYAMSISCEDKQQALDVALAMNRLEMQS